MRDQRYRIRYVVYEKCVIAEHQRNDKEMNIETPSTDLIIPDNF